MKIGEYEVVVVSNDEVKVGCQAVTREQVKDVLRVMDEWKPAPEFKVGDFVRVSSDAWHMHTRGKYGKVCSVGDGVIRVEFAERIPSPSIDGHSIYLAPHNLEKVD